MSSRGGWGEAKKRIRRLTQMNADFWETEFGGSQKICVHVFHYSGTLVDISSCCGHWNGSILRPFQGRAGMGITPGVSSRSRACAST
jgi:hypothetical protein